MLFRRFIECNRVPYNAVLVGRSIISVARGRLVLGLQSDRPWQKTSQKTRGANIMHCFIDVKDSCGYSLLLLDKYIV